MRSLTIITSTKDEIGGSAWIRVTDNGRTDDYTIGTDNQGGFSIAKPAPAGEDKGLEAPYSGNVDGRCTCPWGQKRGQRPALKPCRHVAAVSKLMELGKL